MSLRRVSMEACDWEALDAQPDRLVYQTREWVEFVARTQRAEPVVAELLADGRAVGFFTGLVIRRFGIRILGSPFPGWSTGPMGFNLQEGVSPGEALEALSRFAFGPLRCLHMEILDQSLETADVAAKRYQSDPVRTYAIDLAREEDQIFAGMSSACRRAIRKGEKSVTVEEASGEEFADEYQAQLEDVFSKQAKRPPLGGARVRELIRVMEPTGRLLLLRSVGNDGQRLATGIFLGMNRTAFYWGGASWREHQQLRPNEPLMWHAICHWKSRGATALDLGGGTEEGFAAYKRKFGTEEVTVPFIRTSRSAMLLRARQFAAYVYARRGGG